MQKIDTDILILGGGLSGLLSADLISKTQKRIVILEKERNLGGLAQTIDFNGFKFDIGGHRICFNRKENIDYLKSLVRKDLLVYSKGKIKNFFNNRYVDYPMSLFSLWDIDAKYIINILFDMLRLKKKKRQNNFEEWVISNYGKCLYKIYFKDYTEKVWGESCDRLSSSWADKRIGKNDLFNLIKNILFQDYAVKDVSPFFYYPMKGMGNFIESLSQRLQNTACHMYKSVCFNSQFCHNNGKLQSISFISDNQTFEIFFNRIISTIPIKELLKILPGLSTETIMGLNREIKYRSLILVNLIVNKKLISNWHWCYFASKDILFSRIHEPKFWSKDMAPLDKTLLCVEIFCNYNDIYWNMKDQELIRQVKNALKNIGRYDIHDNIINGVVKRIEYAYPVHYWGFEQALNRIKNYVNTFKNMHLVGRSGTHSYFDMEECLENVRDLVNNLFSDSCGISK